MRFVLALAGIMVSTLCSAEGWISSVSRSDSTPSVTKYELVGADLVDRSSEDLWRRFGIDDASLVRRLRVVQSDANGLIAINPSVQRTKENDVVVYVEVLLIDKGRKQMRRISTQMGVRDMDAPPKTEDGSCEAF